MKLLELLFDNLRFLKDKSNYFKFKFNNNDITSVFKIKPDAIS
jgi:hypothetical protein